MTAVALRPSAERDIADAMAWYDEQRLGLGDVFLENVASLLDLIKDRPAGFPVTHNGFRRALMRRFPYSLYYRDEPGRIVVFAVYHQRRDPNRLAERLSE